MGSKKMDYDAQAPGRRGSAAASKTTAGLSESHKKKGKILTDSSLFGLNPFNSDGIFKKKRAEFFWFSHMNNTEFFYETC
jgi:hypothetical protein